MAKTVLQGLLLGVGMAGLFVSCSDTEGYRPGLADGTGTLVVATDVDRNFVTSKANPATRADWSERSIDDFNIKISNQEGSISKSWLVSDFKQAGPLELAIGAYDVELSYGNIDEEGFDKPYFLGNSSVTVREAMESKVNVTAQIANSMVRCELSDIFSTYFSAYTLKLKSEKGVEYVYTAEDSRNGNYLFLKPGKVTASITVTTQSGLTRKLEMDPFEAQPRHAYTLQFDINGGSGFGTAGSLNVFYDDMLNNEDIIIDISDKALASPAPELTPEGFDNNADWNVAIGGTPEVKRVHVMAAGGIGSVTLNTKSEYLISRGWPESIDLVKGDAQTLQKMKDMGLKMIGFSDPKELAVIDFTELLPNILYLENGNNNTSFSVSAADKYHKATVENMKFNVLVGETTLSFVSQEDLYPFATQVEKSFVVASNSISISAADLSDNALQYKNDRGTYDTCPIVSVAPETRADNQYRISALLPLTNKDLEMRLTYRGKVLDFTLKVNESPYSISCAETSVFAWQALVKVNDKAGNAADNINPTFQFMDGNSPKKASAARHAAGQWILNSVTPATNYTVRAVINNILTNSVEITTEAATQIPNSDMETWSTTGGNSNWSISYPGTSKADCVWATLNEKTTQTKGNYAYNSFSGTRQTSDAHSGNAAIIETVGWGNGNTAGGTASICKNTDIGMLYLGSLGDGYSPVYGYAYASRPKSVSFWYKYSPKNSADYGQASVNLLDAAGNVIASAEQNLTKADAYQQVTFDFTSQYGMDCAKAASIQVIFKSSGNADCLKYNTTNFSTPPFANLSNGRFTGSSLYIDDIKLNF